MEERKRRENLEGYVRNPRNELYIEGLLVSEMMLYLIASLSATQGLFCSVFLGWHPVVGV